MFTIKLTKAEMDTIKAMATNEIKKSRQTIKDTMNDWGISRKTKDCIATLYHMQIGLLQRIVEKTDTDLPFNVDEMRWELDPKEEEYNPYTDGDYAIIHDVQEWEEDLKEQIAEYINK